MSRSTYKEHILRCSKIIDKVIKIALTGTPRQAKFAARFLANSGATDAVDTLIEASCIPIVGGLSSDCQGILEDLADKNDALLLTHLRSLSELALSAPKALEARADEVHRYIMKDIIYKKSTSSEVGP